MSAIRRRHKNPVRIMMSQLALYGRSMVELTIAAVSSTQPAAVIQLRSGCGERKNTSDGWLVWLSSMSTNQLSHRSNRSSSMRSSQADPGVAGQQLGRARRQPGADLEHADQRLTAAERAVDRRQVGDHQRDQAEPDAGLDELQGDPRRARWVDEAEREQRRPAGRERLGERAGCRCPRRSP